MMILIIVTKTNLHTIQNKLKNAEKQTKAEL